MKVLLMCVSGITTNILSRKLQDYSRKQGYADEYIPCRIGSGDIDENIDVILMAPQAETFYKSLLVKSGGYKQKVIILDEKMFVTGTPEEIYNLIKKSSNGSKIQEEQKFHLTSKILRHIISESIIGCFPIFLVGIVANILSYIPMFAFGYTIFETTVGCLNIYFSYAIGFKYGVASKNNPYMMGLLTFATSMLTNNGQNLQEMTLAFHNVGLLMLVIILIKDMIIVIFLSSLTILLLELLRSLFNVNFKLNNQSAIMINQSIVFGFIFFVFLMIRFIFK